MSSPREEAMRARQTATNLLAGAVDQLGRDLGRGFVSPQVEDIGRSFRLVYPPASALPPDLMMLLSRLTGSTDKGD